MKNLENFNFFLKKSLNFLLFFFLSTNIWNFIFFLFNNTIIVISKKLVVCGLLFGHSMYSVEENNFDEDNLSEEGTSASTTEESNSENKNNWNTRKWGDIYFLFPHVSGWNLGKFDRPSNTFWGLEKRMPLQILNFLLSGVVEYKWMFHKYWGINVRLNLNNEERFFDEIIPSTNKQNSFEQPVKNERQNSSFDYKENIIHYYTLFSFEPSIEWVYGRKGKKIFSGSFSPLGFAITQESNGNLVDNFCKNMWTFTFILLKYEYDRRFYLNFGKIKTIWSNFIDNSEEREHIILILFVNFLSIEFGLNIVGVNDLRKKKIKGH